MELRGEWERFLAGVEGRIPRIPFGVLELDHNGVVTRYSPARGGDASAFGKSLFDDFPALKSLRPMFERVRDGDAEEDGKFKGSNARGFSVWGFFVKPLSAVVVCIMREERSGR